jgi:hypothetical protein
MYCRQSTMMQNSHQFQQKGKNCCFRVLSRATSFIKSFEKEETTLQGQNKGPHGDLNPGPPAPKAGIIPLDHADTLQPVKTTVCHAIPYYFTYIIYLFSTCLHFICDYIVRLLSTFVVKLCISFIFHFYYHL